MADGEIWWCVPLAEPRAGAEGYSRALSEGVRVRRRGGYGAVFAVFHTQGPALMEARPSQNSHQTASRAHLGRGENRGGLQTASMCFYLRRRMSVLLIFNWPKQVTWHIWLKWELLESWVRNRNIYQRFLYLSTYIAIHIDMFSMFVIQVIFKKFTVCILMFPSHL